MPDGGADRPAALAPRTDDEQQVWVLQRLEALLKASVMTRKEWSAFRQRLKNQLMVGVIWQGTAAKAPLFVPIALLAEEPALESMSAEEMVAMVEEDHSPCQWNSWKTTCQADM